jgi:peptidoglycan/LPS O-acetylase OafA/YrhL
MTSATERVPIVDGLRGIAILMVVLFHIYISSRFAFQLMGIGIPFEFHTFTQAGYFGVQIFFFVSGFCLMLPYAAAACGKRPYPQLSEYVSRRFWKIVPSYYLALFFVAFIDPIDAQPGISRANDVIVHALFLHGFFEQAYTSLNSNFWSLAVEVEFYVFFPLVAWLMTKRPAIATALCVLVTLAYSNAIASTPLAGTFFWASQLPNFIALFAMGMASAYVYHRWIAGAAISKQFRIEMTWAAIVAFIAVGYVFEQANRMTGGPVAWAWQTVHNLEIAVFLACFTLAGLAATPAFQRAVGNPVLSFFSDVSYNMYLWNAPIIAAIATHWGGPYGGLHGFEAWVFALKALAAVTLVGASITHVFERPLMRWRGGRKTQSALTQMGQETRSR